MSPCRTERSVLAGHAIPHSTCCCASYDQNSKLYFLRLRFTTTEARMGLGALGVSAVVDIVCVCVLCGTHDYSLPYATAGIISCAVVHRTTPLRARGAVASVSLNLDFTRCKNACLIRIRILQEWCILTVEMDRRLGRFTSSSPMVALSKTWQRLFKVVGPLQVCVGSLWSAVPSVVPGLCGDLVIGETVPIWEGYAPPPPTHSPPPSLSLSVCLPFCPSPSF